MRAMLTGLFMGVFVCSAAAQTPWRELQTFQNVILPGKTHLTAIAAGAPPSQQYIDAVARFIGTFDVK